MADFLGLALAALPGAVPVLGSPAHDHFVDAVHGSPNGNGSQSNPWRTITQAMTSGVVVDGDSVHVLRGIYDTALGEVFPIGMPAGVDLVGPGDGTAVVRFTGFSGVSVGGVGLMPTQIRRLAFETKGGSTSAIDVRLERGLSVVVSENHIVGGPVSVRGNSSGDSSVHIVTNRIHGGGILVDAVQSLSASSSIEVHVRRRTAAHRVGS
jgi:hypothetical protein